MICNGFTFKFLSKTFCTPFIFNPKPHPIYKFGFQSLTSFQIYFAPIPLPSCLCINWNEHHKNLKTTMMKKKLFQGSSISSLISNSNTLLMTNPVFVQSFENKFFCSSFFDTSLFSIRVSVVCFKGQV